MDAKNSNGTVKKSNNKVKHRGKSVNKKLKRSETPPIKSEDIKKQRNKSEILEDNKGISKTMTSSKSEKSNEISDKSGTLKTTLYSNAMQLLKSDIVLHFLKRIWFSLACEAVISFLKVLSKKYFKNNYRKILNPNLGSAVNARNSCASGNRRPSSAERSGDASQDRPLTLEEFVAHVNRAIARSAEAQNADEESEVDSQQTRESKPVTINETKRNASRKEPQSSVGKTVGEPSKQSEQHNTEKMYHTIKSDTAKKVSEQPFNSVTTKTINIKEDLPKNELRNPGPLVNVNSELKSAATKTSNAHYQEDAEKKTKNIKEDSATNALEKPGPPASLTAELLSGKVVASTNEVSVTTKTELPSNRPDKETVASVKTVTEGNQNNAENVFHGIKADSAKEKLKELSMKHREQLHADQFTEARPIVEVATSKSVSEEIQKDSTDSFIKESNVNKVKEILMATSKMPSQKTTQIINELQNSLKTVNEGVSEDQDLVFHKIQANTPLKALEEVTSSGAVVPPAEKIDSSDPTSNKRSERETTETTIFPNKGSGGAVVVPPTEEIGSSDPTSNKRSERETIENVENADKKISINTKIFQSDSEGIITSVDLESMTTESGESSVKTRSNREIESDDAGKSFEDNTHTLTAIDKKPNAAGGSANDEKEVKPKNKDKKLSLKTGVKSKNT